MRRPSTTRTTARMIFSTISTMATMAISSIRTEATIWPSSWARRLTRRCSRRSSTAKVVSPSSSSRWASKSSSRGTTTTTPRASASPSSQAKKMKTAAPATKSRKRRTRMPNSEGRRSTPRLAQAPPLRRCPRQPCSLGRRGARHACRVGHCDSHACRRWKCTVDYSSRRLSAGRARGGGGIFLPAQSEDAAAEARTVAAASSPRSTRTCVDLSRA
mmetsp:Transcript_14516/g.45709  ORF Transcript_14516/g.45709 Transcript_14516/m.45709 type:complete len:216 (+) Transcript_14516:158-805(+)